MKHAEGVVVLEVGALTSLADYFVFCTVASKPQGEAVVESVCRSLASHREPSMGVEGRETGRWVLIDCNDVIVHIFRPETRALYDLDRLWGDAHQIPLPEGARGSGV